MNAVLHVPYMNGDCQEDFNWVRELETDEYGDMVIKDHRKYSRGVGYMMACKWQDNSTMLGYNDYEKIRRDYKKQRIRFCSKPCHLYDDQGEPMTIDELIGHYQERDKFVIKIVTNVFKKGDDFDIASELDSWEKDSWRVHSCKRLPKAQLLKHLPKKDFKLTFTKEKSAAIISGCRLLNKEGKRCYVVLVDRITFIKENIDTDNEEE